MVLAPERLREGLWDCSECPKQCWTALFLSLVPRMGLRLQEAAQLSITDSQTVLLYFRKRIYHRPISFWSAQAFKKRLRTSYGTVQYIRFYPIFWMKGPAVALRRSSLFPVSIIPTNLIYYLLVTFVVIIPGWVSCAFACESGGYP